MHQVNNTALGQVIVLPNLGNAQYESVIQKVMSCHICFGKLCMQQNLNATDVGFLAKERKLSCYCLFF